MTEKYETERLPRENISFSIPVEDVIAEVVPAKKKKNNPLPKNSVVLVYLLGHAAMEAGWRFAEPSWGIEVDGTVRGIFPGDKGKDEAIIQAKKVAEKSGRVVQVND